MQTEIHSNPRAQRGALTSAPVEHSPVDIVSSLSAFGANELNRKIDHTDPAVREQLEKSMKLLGDLFGQVQKKIDELESSGAATKIMAGVTQQGVMQELSGVIRSNPDRWLKGDGFVAKLYSELKTHIQSDDGLAGTELHEATISDLPNKAFALLKSRDNLINYPDIQELISISQQRLVVEHAIVACEEQLGNGYRLCLLPQEAELCLMTHPENRSSIFVGGAALRIIEDAFLGGKTLIAREPYAPPEASQAERPFRFSVVCAKTLAAQQFGHEFQHCAQHNETRSAEEFPEQALAGAEAQRTVKEIPESAPVTLRIQHIAVSVWHELLAYSAVGPTEVSVGDGMLKSVAHKFTGFAKDCPEQASASGIAEIAKELLAPTADTAYKVTRWAEQWLSRPLKERLSCGGEAHE